MNEKQYDAFRDEFQKIAKKQKIFDEQARKDLLAGGIGGAVSSIVVSPLEQINNRQTNFNEGFLKATASLWQQGKIPRFYRGLPGKVLKVAPATAVSYAVMMKARDMMK